MTTRNSEYQFRTVSPGALTPAEIQSWNLALEGSAEFDSAFYSYGFARACEDIGCDVYITLATNERGALAGVFAFQKKPGFDGIVGLGERPGGSMNDYSGPMVFSEVASVLTETDFIEASGLAAFDISHAPARPSGPGEDVEAADGGPVTCLAQGFTAWWDTFNEEKKSRASDLGRRGRKIERDFGPLCMTLEAEVTAALLDEIIDEKRRQYHQRDASDVFDDDRNYRLIHRLAKGDDPLCRLVVSTLYAGDTWAASHIGLRCGSVLHYWFPVFNEDLKRSSPGRLLILEMLRAMPQSGLDLLDYGLGESRTKLEFANEVRPFIKGSWVARGAGGVLASGFQRLRWRFG